MTTILEEKKQFVSDLVNKMILNHWIVNKLNAVTEELAETRTYKEIIEDLDKIRNMLMKEWGIVESLGIKTKKIETATEAPPPSSEDRKSTSSKSCNIRS